MPRSGVHELIVLLVIHVACAEILTPPYVNLAQGKRITATATCGEEGPELYCKLVGANADHDEHVIQGGQVCDICDANNDQKKHPPEYAVDGMETWWQSPPLSRGMKYNEVNLTIDLGQEFHVAYVFVRMGNSPRPGLWVLEKSTDYGKTFKPWQYFSDSSEDCKRYFGKESLMPITKDDSVICTTEYSKIVPLEGGEIPISLLNYRPSANQYFNSPVLQEWTRATNVRLRFLRTKNLYGHLMSVARQDPTVTRRYFYSIKDISIGGRCMCNGHADICDPADPEDESTILVCRCQHNTCGPQCNKCCPGFEQKKWRISQHWDRFACEPCNCHNHSTECVYDADVDEKRLSLDIQGRFEGGGVCQNCQHNTEGINCNKCKATFYRPYGKTWGELDVCKPCNCDPHFSTGNCAELTGQCECRKEFKSPNCDSCAHGYFDFPNCKPCTCNLNGTEGEHCTPIGGLCPCKYNYAGQSCEVCEDGYYSPECKNCECNSVGSVSSVCDKESGNCTCKSKYSGRTCNQCEPGYFNYPTCKHCNCDTSGTQASICDDVSGQCICKPGFGGARCDQCVSGYYMEVKGRERQCVECNCSSIGSPSISCAADGKCNCLPNFGGKQCDQCSPGNYKYSECLACNCDVSGSIGSTCDDSGKCHCKPNFDGDKCDSCKEHFYNYPACEECNCDPRGVIAGFVDCGSVPAGELCRCKDRVQGRICNDCKPLYWNLQDYNPLGCEECKCHLAGTLGGLGACDTRSGQCTCKLHVGDRQCDQCQEGFYKLQSDNVFGCTACECDVGGAIDSSCDKTSGQCHCHSRVEGRRCDQPIKAHYFPTLHQFQYELEEGLTQSGPVRYRNQDDQFPGYSWKGYVVFSVLQNEVINIVHVSKSAVYLLVVRYVNRLKDPVSTTITITPESVLDIQQVSTVNLKPAEQPQFATVTNDKGITTPFFMNPGNWTIAIKANKEIMIDYFVLIPEPYYEATILSKLVDKPCVVGDEELCRDYRYPTLSERPVVDYSGLVSSIDKFIDNEQQLNKLNLGPLEVPLINKEQTELQYNLKIDKNGPYVLVIEYITPVNYTIESNDTSVFTPKGIATLRFQSGDGPESVGIVKFNECPYTVPCRQVAVDDLSKINVFNVQDTNNVIYLEGVGETTAGIKSITAIPEAEWILDYITPKPHCLRRNGKCHPAVFTPVIAKKVEIESGTGGDRDSRPPILDNSTSVVYLSPDAGPVTVEAKVPSPGGYHVILHYYQPEHPESTLPVTLVADNQQITEASVVIEHCPSNSGCRALLRSPEKLTLFGFNDNVTLTFKADNTKGVYLDYILVVASSDFVDTSLRESNSLDYKREFIDKCANNHYYVDTNTTGFCRDALFSITSEYNSGTLGCQCDVEGSTDLECEQFGGQCRCKDNVIGRTCSSCRTGYYGFPNCRPCHCPSTAVCDDYGECICPKNVEGENCDRCKKFTFNYDELRGCDDCNCNPLGVRDNQLQCDDRSGNCQCKENIIGRVCDHCVPGHYSFPHCLQCSCDVHGTTDEVCDQNTAQCYCKKHVTGQVCDTCKDEYFNLQSDNPEGCTKCHCFGKTTRCMNSGLYWADIFVMSDWYLLEISVNRSVELSPSPATLAMINNTVIEADVIDSTHTLYFSAPDYYLGKRLNSYGGLLSYTIYYTARMNGHAISAPDVIIASPIGYLLHVSIEQPSALLNWPHSVRISEDQFTNIDGTAVTRDQFMNVLNNVTGIYIRAAYEAEVINVRLMSVSLEMGTSEPLFTDSIPRLASSVEQCECPKAYRGLSCEQCALGYYRISQGRHAGLCVPCQCNSHTQHCDVNTGVCLDCQDNTMGDHCEQCIPGYHGDATLGTPRDCLICACPMPYTSNNFALGCDLSENGSLISCECKEGYGGPRCEFCSAGYYGQPEVFGDSCKPCNCSGNIIQDDPGSCDSITGDCLKCVNNTAGAACNLCAPGYFGDAIEYKNCTACHCDLNGMLRCDPTTGTCECRPGVVGPDCGSCQVDHWGLLSGQGCQPCQCGEAAKDTQCDLVTGHCACAKGVTGPRCEQCAAGYWNYSKDGCDRCNCNSGYSMGFMCNATGQCECLPGVIGEKCDRCPERWVLIPGEGCLECDSCTDALIFSVQDLTDLLANETQDFKNKADSFFTTQRLNYIKNQTERLRPQVTELRSLDDETVTQAVNALEQSAKNLLRSAEFAATDSDKQITRAASLSSEAQSVLQLALESGRKAQSVVGHVADLATGLELSHQPKVDSALADAEQIHSDLLAAELKPREAYNAFTNSSAHFERMNAYVLPVNQQANKLERAVNASRALQDKLDDILKYTDLAEHTAVLANALNVNNKLSKVGNKVTSVTKLNNAAMKEIIDSAIDISNATLFYTLAQETLKNSTRALRENEQAKTDMVDRLTQLDEELPQLKELTKQAAQHAETLREQAENLRIVSERENNNSRTQDAYAAASAYSSIVNEIGDAKKNADQAKEALQKITDINEKLKVRVSPSRESSTALHHSASEALNLVQSELAPNLTKATELIHKTSQTLNNADENNSAILVSLPNPGQSSLHSEKEKADRVKAITESTIQVMSELKDELGASKEWAQTLPKQADDALKMMFNVRSLMKDIEEMRPNISTTTDSVTNKQMYLEQQQKDAAEKLAKLKELVEQARTVANRIGVGVTFDRRSTLQPRLPDSLDEMSTSTHVSAYFRTKEPNGMILYLGNPTGTKLRRTRTDDFMVIAIQNGYPYLLMDIGDSYDSGRSAARIQSDKYVADNRWYQVVVDRVGRNVKLSIRESLDNGTELSYAKELLLPGQHTIFNVDKKKSKLYVGGAPATLQEVSYPAFEGQIEELVIGDTPVGLWNFQHATNLKGARQRDKLITSQSGPQEYRFNGRAHVTMPGRRYLEKQRNQVLLFFRTYAPDGLIYLVGNGNYFFSIQMQDGKVYLQVSLGDPENDLVILGTAKSYNDGKWHKLDAGRYNAKCSLKVDDEVLTMSSSSSTPEISEVDTMNFGGNNKGIVQVTNQGFDGCIKQISIDNVHIDFSENVESIGVSYGCQFSSLVSLSGYDSYLRYTDIPSDNIQLTLKFRTADADGLIFLYVSRTQVSSEADSVSLALVKGKLVLISREQLDTGLSTYNDSQWHVVTVSHNNNEIKLVVDDYDYFSKETNGPLHISDGVLFIGGVQPGYVVGGRLPSKSPFKGCIADASLNSRQLNLLEPFSNSSVTFGWCGDTTSTGGVFEVHPVLAKYEPKVNVGLTRIGSETSWHAQESTPDESRPESRPEPEEPQPAPKPTPEVPTTLPPEIATDAPKVKPHHSLVPLVSPPPVTRRPAPAPQPEQGCALAYDPYYTVGSPDEGYRFGTSINSHLKYSQLPGRQRDGFDLSITFRTFDEHGGLIFYANNEQDQTQFLAIYMKGGQLHFLFNCGHETGLVTSPKQYNDALWHTLVVVRRDMYGKLTVDHELVGEASVACNDNSFLSPPYYYGGATVTNSSETMMHNLMNFYQPFKGCLKGLMMNNQYATEVMERVQSLRCTDNVEDGVYFGPSTNGHSNYLKFQENFNVGTDFSISMEVKPRNSTGLLLSIHGRKDFFVLELLEDEVVANVENGKGPFHAIYKLGNKFSLCDGNWHTIQALKSRHVVSVGVDGHFSDPGIGISRSTDTRSAVFIGGHEKHISKVRGIRSRRGFTGCIRKIVIRENAIKIPLKAAYKNTHIGVCPKD